MDRNLNSLEARRAFTVFQLMTILEESWPTGVFWIDCEQAKVRKAEAKMPGAQATLEAYS
jgi:hypothetical protein